MSSSVASLESPRATTTKSIRDGSWCCCKRKASLMRRFIRFRTTAEPTFRLTVTPSRGGPSSLRPAMTTK